MPKRQCINTSNAPTDKWNVCVSLGLIVMGLSYLKSLSHILINFSGNAFQYTLGADKALFDSTYTRYLEKSNSESESTLV